jgi:hypothetical protein
MLLLGYNWKKVLEMCSKRILNDGATKPELCSFGFLVEN